MTHPDENPIGRRVAPFARFLVLAGGWWLLALSFATCAEILARKFLGRSFQGIDEVGAYTLAVFSSLAFAWALVTKAHTRVDFLLAHLPAPVRAVLNALAYALLAGLAVFAAWRGLDVVSESIEFQSHANSPLGTPLWIPQSLWLLGLVTFAACAVLFALHALFLLVVDRARLNRLYGPMTLDEEVEAEASALLSRTQGKELAP
ncbi:TRAP transporter small permease [Sediminicoccus sp. KRV36]|uniref:TRAP transporter small permease subunit n=1 Tax=Sediminicoccus sp. KRV36 TaxID=3133721 RepID=UPI00200EA38B|nr:TRAP transporter small permease [Sediminicoccus rosea]UPY38336.1 TRAP transporter small permease [Sediminicoccus rosea]